MLKPKVVLIGDTAVGKTAIFNRLQFGIFTPEHVTTIGGAFSSIKVETDKGNVELAMWDTAGQERFRNVVPMYFQHASFVVLVVSLTSRETFEHLSYWIDLAKQRAPENVKFILLGNKQDDAENREVTFEELTDIGESIGACQVFETSALTGVGIDVFSHALADITLEGVEETTQTEMETKGSAPPDVGQETKSRCC